MFTAKELRGNNSMLGRVQRQQDCSYKEKLDTFNKLNLDVEEDDFGNLLKSRKLSIPMERKTIKEPTKIVTKFELGNKRRLLR
jgi:hypothetical protein